MFVDAGTTGDMSASSAQTGAFQKKEMKYMNEIVSLIGTVGFPIVMCLLMCVYINKINEDYKKEIVGLNEDHKNELLELKQSHEEDMLELVDSLTKGEK